MKRKRLIYQIFPSYLAIIVIAVIALIWLANRSFQDFYYQEKTVELKARAVLVGSLVAAGGDVEPAHLNDICRELGRATGMRITIIARSGKVLGDSHENPEVMDNHGDRPEVLAALEGRTGSSVRYSHTLGQEMMYLAIPVSVGETGLIVRTSLPVTSIQEAISDIRLSIIIGGIVVTFIAALFSFLVSRRMVRPLEEMKRGAERFAGGELDHKLPLPRTEEMAALAESLNHMAKQLHNRVKTIERQRNEREAILASMTEGVLAVDGEERVISLNAAAADMLGIDRNTAISRPIQAVVRNTTLCAFVREVLSGKRFLEADLMLSTRTGDRFLKMTGTRLQEEGGGNIGALIMLNDFTNIRRLENIRRDFVANVSHELKTPITSIKGFVETLREGRTRDPDEMEQFLAIIARQADRLDAIIDDLLELSRLEQKEGHAEFRMERASVRGVLERAAMDCREQAVRKDIEIEIACDENLSALMNKALMERAVVNLVDNAIKYSSPGGRVTVTADRQGGDVVIAVRDEGIGIAREHFDRLFERFYRVDKARSREQGGTGLGLAIVKHITQVHGGSVSVQSTLGKGSVFTIRIPAEDLKGKTRPSS